MLERFMKRYSTPEGQAKLMRWLWLISTGFMLFGFAVILYLIIF